MRKVTSLTLEHEILKMAKIRAIELGKSLGTYVEGLIERDLNVRVVYSQDEGDYVVVKGG